MKGGVAAKVSVRERVVGELTEFAIITAYLYVFLAALIGRALHLGERFNALPLIWPTLYKSVVFLVLLLVLNALEEVIVGFMHHRKVVDSLAEFGGGTLAQLTASSIVVLLILIPFFAFRALGEVVGERNLVRVFFLQRHNIDAG
jgi:hypothetical protein